MNKELTPSIRTATAKDAGDIARIHMRSWQKMYRDFIPDTILNNLSLHERTQQWDALIRKEVKVLVMEINHRIQGFASICPFRDPTADNSMGEISAIYIRPEYWRQGLGTQLCLAAISELEKEGYNKIFLWIFEANVQAKKFYEALGFTATHSTKLAEFYEGGALFREVLYQKSL